MVAPTVSQGQGRRREAGSGCFAKPEANLRLEGHEANKEAVRSGELATDNEAQCDQRPKQ